MFVKIYVEKKKERYKYRFCQYFDYQKFYIEIL